MAAELSPELQDRLEELDRELEVCPVPSAGLVTPRHNPSRLTHQTQLLTGAGSIRLTGLDVTDADML